MQMRESTLALKPRADVTRNLKWVLLAPRERTYVLQKLKNTNVCLELWCLGNPVLKSWFPCQIYSVDDISL